MTEHEIQQAILAKFGSDPRLRIFRINVVVRMDAFGRPVRSGQKGMSDISGILLGGRRLECEVKSATGRLRSEQESWLAMINRFGGLGFVARSVDDFQIQIDAAFPVA